LRRVYLGEEANCVRKIGTLAAFGDGEKEEERKVL
jgi:hypothetical protein